MTRLMPMLRTLVILPVVLIAFATAARAQNEVVLQGQPTPEQLEAYTLMQHGVAHLQMKDARQALSELQQAARIWPALPHVHYYLGFCNQELGQYQNAVPEFEKAIATDPQRADCMVNIGTCYQLAGQPGKAADWLEKYCREVPRGAKVQQARAMIPQLRKQSQSLSASGTGNANTQKDYLPQVCIGGKARRWSRQKLPLKVFIANGTNDQGVPVRGFNPEYNYLLLEAFQDWMKASGGRLSFTMVPSINTADIICSWTDDPSLAAAGGNQTEQGVAERYEQEYGDGQVSINASRLTIYLFSRSAGQPLSRLEMKKACLHEVGHTLGLAGHSLSNQDIMFYSETPALGPQLSQRDAATITRLYAAYPPAP